MSERLNTPTEPVPESQENAGEILHNEVVGAVADYLKPYEEWRKASVAKDEEAANDWNEKLQEQNTVLDGYDVRAANAQSFWWYVQDCLSIPDGDHRLDSWRNTFKANNIDDATIDELGEMMEKTRESGGVYDEDEAMRLAAEMTAQMHDNYLEANGIDPASVIGAGASEGGVDLDNEPVSGGEVLDDEEEAEKAEFLDENPDIIPGMGESAADLVDLEDDEEIIEGNGKEEEEVTDVTPENAGPLVAVNLDLKKDAADAAHDIAEKMFLMKKEERSKEKGFRAVCKSIWGNFTDSKFREAKIRHYEKKAYEMILEKQAGGETDLKDEDWAVNSSGIERFVQAYVNGFEEEMIHRSAGEEMNVYGVETDEEGNKTVYRYNKELENGKEALDADDPEAVATIDMREAISGYAKGEMDQESFEEEVKRIKQNLAGKDEADLMIDNYMALAEAAKERVTHEEKIENVMEGFRLINGEARRNVRSEAHRNALDKITSKLTNNPLGRLVPPEAIGIGVGVVTAVLQSTARTTARALVPGVGGAAVAGSLAALKEGNRMAWDRQDLARRLARGESAGDTKYDEQMLDTMYEMKPATEYTEELNEKIKAAKEGLSPDSLGALLESLARAETAVKLGDSAKHGVDLISYSSGDTAVIEKERLALDVARAQAKSLLGRDKLDHSVAYAKALELANETFEEDMDAKDKVYKKLRKRREMSQAGKAALTTGITMFAGQEIKAAFSPDKYGVLDEVFHLHNNAGAENTALMRAGTALGFVHGNTRLVQVEELTDVVLTDEQAEKMRAAGYNVHKNLVSSDGGEHAEKVVRKTKETVKLSAKEYAQKYGTRIKRDGWAPDRSEVVLSDPGKNGAFVANLGGKSLNWNGKNIDYEAAAEKGKIKLLVSLTKGTQSRPIEIAGKLGEDGKLNFMSDDPKIQKLIEKNAFKYAEVVYDNGSDGKADHVVALATEVGKGYKGDGIAETVVKKTKETVYDVIDVKDKAGEATYDLTRFERQPVEEVMSTWGIPLTGKRKELTLGEGAGDGRGGPSVTEGAYTDEAHQDVISTIQGAGRGGAEYYNNGEGSPTGSGTEGQNDEPQPGSEVLDDDEEEPAAETGNPDDEEIIEGNGTEEETNIDEPVTENSPEADMGNGGEPEAGGEVLDDEEDELVDRVRKNFLTWDWDEEVDRHPGHLSEVAANHLIVMDNAKSRLWDMRARGAISQEKYDAVFNAIEKIRIEDREELKERLAQSQAKTPEDMEKPVRTVTKDENGNNVESTIPLVDRFIQTSYDSILRRQQEQADN